MVSTDRIKIALPCKAEYVSVARLTVSGIASRMGFDIETVEDIKVAISEVCSRIIGAAAGMEGQYEIQFDILDEGLVVTFTSDITKTKCIFDNDDDELGMSIINAFMDKVEVCHENNGIIVMTKNFEVIPANGL